jgi:hypothetical protein
MEDHVVWFRAKLVMRIAFFLSRSANRRLRYRAIDCDTHRSLISTAHGNKSWRGAAGSAMYRGSFPEAFDLIRSKTIALQITHTNVLRSGTFEKVGYKVYAKHVSARAGSE